MPDTHWTFAVRIADRLRQRVADTAMVLPDGRSLSVTVSIGCAMRGSPDDDTVEALMERADQALYRAKNAGRNRVEQERKGVVSGKGGAVRVDPGGRRIIKNTQNK